MSIVIPTVVVQDNESNTNDLNANVTNTFLMGISITYISGTVATLLMALRSIAFHAGIVAATKRMLIFTCNFRALALRAPYHITVAFTMLITIASKLTTYTTLLMILIITVVMTRYITWIRLLMFLSIAVIVTIKATSRFDMVAISNTSVMQQTCTQMLISSRYRVLTPFAGQCTYVKAVLLTIAKIAITVLTLFMVLLITVVMTSGVTRICLIMVLAIAVVVPIKATTR